eukprot:scaffold92534_cov69-Phaeocystis_antarctica.AAC.1
MVGRKRLPTSSKKCCATRVSTGWSLPTRSLSDVSKGRSWLATTENGSGSVEGGSWPKTMLTAGFCWASFCIGVE